MSLIQAETASIRWRPEKRHWTVTIAIGEEVIKRSPAGRSLMKPPTRHCGHAPSRSPKTRDTQSCRMK